MSERIGVYRVEGRLGRGGMGEVLLAWDDRLERRVAIKRIRQDAGLTPEQRERFRREARLAARLSHSAVVQIHDLVSEGPDDAIVMEYVEGETLAERLKSGPLALDVALRLGQEIAEGLAAAHDAGLIHRDLKAANVIVTQSGRAKILDFGLARPVDRQPDDEPLTRQGMVIGTFHAMSPEQARGEDLDARSDLFSLGVLLYEMLTGRAPFRGKDPVDTLQRVVHEPPADPRALRPDLPTEMTELLDRLLAKDRRDRPAGAGEVVAVLEGLRPVLGSSAPLLHPDTVSDLPTAAARAVRSAPVSSRAEASAPASSTSPSQRRRWLLFTLPLLGLLLVPFVWHRAPERPPIRVYMHIPEPAGAKNDEPLDFAVSALQAAGWGALSSLEGISPVDPTFVQGASGSPQEIAQQTAADEILFARLERQEGMGHVWLRRVRASDNTVLGTDDFTISLAPDEKRLAAQSVVINLPKIYPDHSFRPGTPDLDVREEDFSDYVKVKRDLDDGKLLLASAFSDLEKIIQGSPSFLDARLLAAQVALSVFQSTRNVDLLSTAWTHIREAKALAPNDPRPIIVEIRAARTENDLEQAEAALNDLSRLLPGDPEVLVQKALLRESQGRLDESVDALRSAVERAPSWKTKLSLAQMEAREGSIEVARSRFDEILQHKPDNPWVLEAWARMEMSYGDLQRAETIYTKLANGGPPRFSHFNNLGLVHTFRRQPSQAARAYQRALEIAPDNAMALVNLADAKFDLGRRSEAAALYQSALQKISEQEPATGLPPEEALLKAQCLARLEQGPEAVDLVQRALRESPDDAKTHLQAALVYSMTGDRNSALNSAKQAISLGIALPWFGLSAFDPIRAELQPLLKETGAS